MDPLHDFSEACRRELQSADRRCGFLTVPLFQYFGWWEAFFSRRSLCSRHSFLVGA
jgi:hypothetical protein